MYLTFRWFGAADPIPLAHIRQIPGIRGVVSALYDVPVGAPLVPVRHRVHEPQWGDVQIDRLRTVSRGDDSGRNVHRDDGSGAGNRASGWRFV